MDYGTSCWDPYREDQINALDRVQKKAARFADHTTDSVWETLAQHRKTAGICAPYKPYTGEGERKDRGDGLQSLCHLCRDDLDLQITARGEKKKTSGNITL
jgi:hypothetical protein